MSTRPAWHEFAACRGTRPDIWFDNPNRAPVHLCATCPVRAKCREAGANEPYGVWGGVGPASRPLIPQRGRVPSGDRPVLPFTPERRTAMYQLAALAAQVLREAAA